MPKSQLDVVFVNLITNAIDAMKHDGTITIRLIDDDSVVEMEFEDTGPTILPDMMKNMFEPLFATKQKGTGLGLASCRNMIEQHHGKIPVTSDPTAFSSVLPKIL